MSSSGEKRPLPPPEAPEAPPPEEGREGVTRREALKIIGASAISLAVGAAIGYATAPPRTIVKEIPKEKLVVIEKPKVKEIPTPRPKKGRVIVVKPELCAGCRLCELMCALTWEGKADPRYSRIRVMEFFGGLIAFPVVCIPCADKPCIKACPTGALSYDPKTGALKLDESKCIACPKCFEACPAGALFPHPEKGIPLTCTKCMVCVYYCPTGALEAWKGILTFEQALAAKKPEEIARDLLKKYYGVESPEELEKKYHFWTPERAKEFGVE